MGWFVYIVRGSDKSLYTGITTDPTRRIREHNTSNVLGAKSLRNKRPVKLVYQETYKTRTEAAKRERTIKSWSREDKIKLIKILGPIAQR